jgi:hypothetical protein
METVGPAMSAADQSLSLENLSFSPHPSYEQYLKIHKVFVGSHTAITLERIHEDLSQESLPRYLSVAGWAAAEAALVQDQIPTKSRLALLDAAIDCWDRGARNQMLLNQSEKTHMIEYSAPYRMALDVAISPLLRGIILGDVTDKIVDDVFEDCLEIANANAEEYRDAFKLRQHDRIAEHSGFGYECNALLAFNRLKIKTWFAIPALARSDSGHHHPEQSHDLSIIRQKWGTIKGVMPVEIKAAANARAKRRYKALLVRGKMHLSVPGKYPPTETLDAINAVHQGVATEEQQELAELASSTFIEMLRDYRSGEVLGGIATERSITTFRDNSVVVSKHPGLNLVV